MKRKRTSRAKNKLQGSQDASLTKAEPDVQAEATRVEAPRVAVTLRRSTLFNAELEEAIDVIARERVYQAMMAGVMRRMLAPPQPRLTVIKVEENDHQQL